MIRLGEPIDVGQRLVSGGRSRDLSAVLTAELEMRIQSLLDEIGPGRPLPEAMVGGLATAAPM